MGSFLSTGRDRTVILLVAAILLVWRFPKPVRAVFASLLARAMKLIVPSPPGPFKLSSVPEPPDYDSPDSWAAYPGKSSEAELVPDGEAGVPCSDRPADMLFLHPTGYYGKSWNQPDAGQPSSGGHGDEQTRYWMLAMEASAFNRTCRIYAPHYRQAHIGSYFFDQASGRQALEVAYSDVKRSFHHFLAQVGHTGRPIVLASHSQGGHHLSRLLAEEVDGHPEILSRLVCVYLVGSRLPLHTLRAKGTLVRSFRESTGPTDHVGLGDGRAVVCGWDTLGEWFGCVLPQLEVFAGGLPTFPGLWQRGAWRDTVLPVDILSTNPLSWRPSSDHQRVSGASSSWLGSIMTVNNLGKRQASTVELVGGQAVGLETVALKKNTETLSAANFWAQSQEYGLVVPTLPLRYELLGCTMRGGWYHCVDFSLFWFNIRANVAERVAAYLAHSKQEVSDIVQRH